MSSDQTTTSEPIVDMQNVSIRYGTDPEVLSNIKLRLEKGSFHFLTGKSGAGKTSLLSLMYLALKPSRGTVMVFGTNVGYAGRDTMAFLRRRIGVVFQDFRLLEHLSAYDNVAAPLRVRGMNEKEIDKRVKELLRWVELDKSMRKICSTLSGGEKQRVAIARAVINRPEILLADEPTGNVDNDIAEKLMKLFVELNRLGTTVVIATHSADLIDRYNYPRIHLEDKNLKIFPALRKSSRRIAEEGTV
jgi:cell division transport system ATP-binding protein